MMKRTLFCLLICCFVIIPAAAQGTGDCPRDTLLPQIGNCGYDVLRYDLNIRWDPDDDRWDVNETITMNSLWDSPEAVFDFSDRYRVHTLRVNERDADFTLKGEKLTIHHPFTHDTRYSIDLSFSGEVPRFHGVLELDYFDNPPHGKVFNLNEPDRAHFFFACNDHPRDPAHITLTAHVPENYTVASSGKLLKIIEADGSETLPYPGYIRADSPSAGKGEGEVLFIYENQSVAPYLLAVEIGQYETRVTKSSAGTLQIDFVDSDSSPEFQEKAWRAAALTDNVIDFCESIFGPYPYDARGGIFSNVEFGGALETQGRPVYDALSVKGYDPMNELLVHEIAHQWIGNLIPLSDWSLVWVKEGFADFIQTLYILRQKGENAFREEIKTRYEKVANSDRFSASAGALLNLSDLQNLDLPVDPQSMNAIARELLGRDLTAAEHQELNDSQSVSETIHTILQSQAEDTTAYISLNLFEIISTLYQKAGVDFNPMEQFPLYRRMEPISGPLSLPDPHYFRTKVGDMYGTRSYTAGSLIFYVIYAELGDESFIRACQNLVNHHAEKPLTLPDLIDTFNEASETDIGDLITPWLRYDGTLPDLPGIVTYQEARRSAES